MTPVVWNLKWIPRVSIIHLVLHPSALHAAKMSDGISCSIILTPRSQETEANGGALANYPANCRKRSGLLEGSGAAFGRRLVEMCVGLLFENTHVCVSR